MTYADMTDDELRLEVAKRCGWKKPPRSPKEAEELGWTRVDPYYSGPLSIEFSSCLGKPIYNPPFRWKLIRDFPDYPRDPAAALALLDSMTYPPEKDGRRVPVAYVIIKQTCNNVCDIYPLDKPEFTVTILGRNPINSTDYEATADTISRAACEAWLAWKDGKEAQNDKG